MMRDEFEKLTGIFPTVAQYKLIEEEYYESPDDKQTFCKKFKANKNGIAERVQHKLFDQECKADVEAAEKERQHKAEIEELQKRIARLKAELDRELEWKPYFDEDSMSQERYNELYEACAKEHDFLLDDAAIAWISRETGFAPDKIHLITKMPVQEINRHRAIRETGEELERRPLYYSSDWNYALFEVCGYTYEIADGEMVMIPV